MAFQGRTLTEKDKASATHTTTHRPIAVMILGTRGPGCEGGIERHVENLVPLLASSVRKIVLLGRSPYRNQRVVLPANVEVKWLWAPKVRWLETLLHSFLGLVYAIVRRPDVLHIHAIGPALTTPIARMFGLKVVVTHHGFDYDRERWGEFAKTILRLGESLGMRFANERIVISRDIQRHVKQHFAVDSHLIPNGVHLPTVAKSEEVLIDLGLISGRYVLQVSRCVPEKRQTDLAQAFIAAAVHGWKLVLVGGLRDKDEYSERLRMLERQSEDIILAGFRTGTALNELYSHAGLFVLPSSHEGLPIALLEALSHGLNSVVSNIPSNLEVGLSEKQYFELGNVAQLAEKIREFSDIPTTNEDREERRAFVKERYNWETIAQQTLQVLSLASIHR